MVVIGSGQLSTGTKKSRWRTFCTKTKSAYSATDAIPANASCVRENSGPGALVVNVGRTRHSVARVITVANAVAVPSALKVAMRWRSVATTRQSPTMPLQVIIAAAKTVSRASVSGLGATRRHQRDDESDLDDRHRDREDERSERFADRWATTSAWCTAASTAPREARNEREPMSPGFDPQVAPSAINATAGTTSVHGR